jgi:hypothetical protein
MPKYDYPYIAFNINMYENMDLFIFLERATMNEGLKVSSPAKCYAPPLSHPQISDDGLEVV